MRRARPYPKRTVGPRGDLPGFVVALDDRTLLLPDRPGNEKLETLQNILEHSNVALIFFVPGRNDSLRVNGRARITTDPALLDLLAVQGKSPLSVHSSNSFDHLISDGKDVAGDGQAQGAGSLEVYQ